MFIVLTHRKQRLCVEGSLHADVITMSSIKVQLKLTLEDVFKCTYMYVGIYFMC